MYPRYLYGVLTTAFVVVGLCMFPPRHPKALGGPTANPMIFGTQICSFRERVKLSMYESYSRFCRSFVRSLLVDTMHRSAVS